MDGLTKEQLEKFEEYYFSVNKFSCNKDDARDSNHYRECYWVYEKACKDEELKIANIKKYALEYWVGQDMWEEMENNL